MQNTNLRSDSAGVTVPGVNTDTWDWMLMQGLNLRDGKK